MWRITRRDRSAPPPPLPRSLAGGPTLTLCVCVFLTDGIKPTVAESKQRDKRVGPETLSLFFFFFTKRTDTPEDAAWRLLH